MRMRLPIPKELKRTIIKDGLRPNELRNEAFRRVIRSVPKGKVSTYGKVAAAAGYPLYHRAVARLLRADPPHGLPGNASSVRVENSSCAERQRLSKDCGFRWKA